MNLVVTCEGCAAIYRVLQQQDGTDVDLVVGEHSEFWSDRYLCPRCGARATGMHENFLPRGMQTSSIVDLTAEELLAALYGLGLPEERKTTLDEVKSYLIKEGGNIRKVVGSDVAHTGRCVIDRIELMDGTKIYFGASAHGAVIYRVVHPISYVQRFVEEAANGSGIRTRP